jgi:thiol-disulfide isomerase/thioredoxin
MMKFIGSFALFFCFLGLQAQINYEPTLTETFAKAKREKKLVFVKYYNSDCPVCKSLEILFQDKALADFYNQNFVSYALNTKDMLEENTKFLQAANLTFSSVPFLLFFDADRNFLHYSHIQQDTRFLLEIAQNALKPAERTINLANKYKAGDRSIKTLYAYNNFLQVQKQDDLARLVAKDLFEVFPKNELASKKSFIITRDCVSDVDNGFFQFWIKNMDKAFSFYDMGKVKSDLAEIITKSIYYPNRPTWSLEKIRQVKEYILLTELSQKPDSFFWQEESKVLVEQKKESEALVLGKKIFDAEEEIPTKLFTLQHFAELCKEKASLRSLQNWLKSISLQSAAPQDQADYYFVELLLLKKLGEKQKFQKNFALAKEFYQKHQIDTQNLEGLKK